MGKKQFAIIGLGRFGSSVAKTLEKLGYKVLAVDCDEKLIQEIKDHVSYAKQLNATDLEALKEAGVGNCDVAIVAIGGNMQSNILTTLLLKELGVKEIVVKAQNALHAKIVEKLGATKVICPEEDMGVSVGRQLASSSNVMECLELSSADYAIEEVKPTQNFIGKTIEEIQFKKEYGIRLIAVKQQDKLITRPSFDRKIQEGDVLLVIGSLKEIEEFGKKLMKENKE